VKAILHLMAYPLEWSTHRKPRTGQRDVASQPDGFIYASMSPLRTAISVSSD
jgi:hypothetical protein